MNYSRVVRAIVRDAWWTVGENLTVATVCDYYGLEWGTYANGANRAEQLVRNELNRQVANGHLQHKSKDGPWVVYEPVVWHG